MDEEDRADMVRDLSKLSLALEVESFLDELLKKVKERTEEKPSE